MGHAAHFVIRLYAWLDGLEWLWRLAVRLSVGIEFFGSGPVPMTARERRLRLPRAGRILPPRQDLPVFMGDPA
jgi:hypothetical protein